jgi:hypothetical protein
MADRFSQMSVQAAIIAKKKAEIESKRLAALEQGSVKGYQQLGARYKRLKLVSTSGTKFHTSWSQSFDLCKFLQSWRCNSKSKDFEKRCSLLQRQRYSCKFESRRIGSKFTTHVCPERFFKVEFIYFLKQYAMRGVQDDQIGRIFA